MSGHLEELLNRFKGNPGASHDSIESLQIALGIRLPDDFITFLTTQNGGEGFVGKHYMMAWRVEEIIPFNLDYQVSEYAPGLLLFASSGGGEAFAFDMRSKELPIVQVPFIGLALKYAKVVAPNFSNLLVNMSRSNGSLL